MLTVEDMKGVYRFTLQLRIGSVCDDDQQDNLNSGSVAFTEEQGDGQRQEVRPTEQEPNKNNQEEEEESSVQYSVVRKKIGLSPQSVQT